MKLGRPIKPLIIREEDKEELERIVRSRTVEAGIRNRAEIVLLSSQGRSSTEVGKKLGVTAQTVCKWRDRFSKQGLRGLSDEVRTGRPRTLREERVAELIQRTIGGKPAAGTHWSCRTFAMEHGVSKSTVQRLWNAFALKPHRHESFKISNDPNFVEKVIDITGLYLAPPENAIVLCVDEKSQCQALQCQGYDNWYPGLQDRYSCTNKA